ncbi:MGDG synthase family glycosyltransferase [Anaerosalibacter massiliensis]|nr:glycosyltransferase [Anaerosalibacter massiliensis]
MEWFLAMDSKVDILILTASFGAGHASASLGIKEQIQRIDPSISIEIVDIFQVLFPKLSRAMYKGYNVLVRNNPKLYNYFHYRGNEKPRSNMNKIFSRPILIGLKDYILDINPKLIISTFPIVSQYISDIKDIYDVSIPLITCITDVVNGWEWIAPNCDKYFVATKDVEKEMLKMGIKRERIVVTGIPLRKEFLKSLKSSFNISLPEEHILLMIMGGGMGLIPEDEGFYKWLNSLNKITAIVLTGKNNDLFESISAWNLENIIPLKYTNEVAPLMLQSDLLITKAGGITVFEAIASSLPLIIYKPELGQELENMKFIQEKAIGRIAFNIESLKCIITDFINNQNEIIEYEIRMAKLRYDINMNVLAKESIKLMKNF